MPLHSPDAKPSEWIEEDIQQIVRLEEIGFVEAWVGEHFTQPWEALPTPDLLIANALGRTSTIRLGTGVNALPSHHPAMLAHRIAVLDQMAKGRFMWGIGSGGARGDFVLYDIDPSQGEHQQLTRDVLDAVLNLWSDPKPGVYEHRRWKIGVPEPNEVAGIKLHMKPYQLPHPLIATAGIGPKSDMLTLAGENGWIPMSIMFVSIPVLAEHWKTYEGAALGAGKEPKREDWRISREVFVADTPEEARKGVLDGTLARDWEQFLIPHTATAGLMFAFKQDPDMSDEEVTPAYLAETLWIVGDVEEVVDKLYNIYESTGGFGKLLVMHHEWDKDGRWERSMELLHDEVMPRLEARIGEKLPAIAS
jgi:alkanesulfonate monooxygenase SsuD/methylene tetrahydromethanopterin reductase-like flavin-dependent oxidoreductase (luciferase family)